MALGIENLKKVLVAAIHLADKIDDVTQDGFQIVADSIALIPNIGEAVAVVKNGKDALAEYKDLDDVERAEVLAYVQIEFDLEDDKLEAVIEAAFKTIASIGDLVVKVRLALQK